jgi:hypothetical protein
VAKATARMVRLMARLKSRPFKAASLSALASKQLVFQRWLQSG